MLRHATQPLLAATAAALLATAAATAAPYAPVPVSGVPVVGPGMSAPDGVYGKEYTHDPDFSPVTGLDPEQIIAWDGIGGTADAIDYTGTRMGAAGEFDAQLDAIANSRDALFDEVLRDGAHLVFSHDNFIFGYDLATGGVVPIPVPPPGPITLANGSKIGGAGELSVEEAFAFGAPMGSQMLWASQPEISLMPLPDDVDGVELWGPEPRIGEEPDAPVVGDANKYSIDVDFPLMTSVWNGSGTPYLGHDKIVDAVTKMLGPIPSTAIIPGHEGQRRQLINLDALMVSDILEDPDFFNEDSGVFEGQELLDQNGEPIEPFGNDGEMRGDAIIFSIRQVLNPGDPLDPDGYYATGSELFVLDSLGGVSFLEHGGHLWDHGYALSDLMVTAGPDGEPIERFRAVIDINAIEAIGEEVVSPPVGLPGDFNGDGKVDVADYTVWRDNLGTGDPLAGNGDETGTSMGVVDKHDYLLWRSNFGAMTMPSPLMASAVSAPEPAAAVLLLAAAGGLLVRRR